MSSYGGKRGLNPPTHPRKGRVSAVRLFVCLLSMFPLEVQPRLIWRISDCRVTDLL